MIFASKTPRDLNHDPEPWVIWHIKEDREYGRGGEETRAAWSQVGMWWELRYTPRPEFDPPKAHNEPNPILVGIRGNIIAAGGIHRDRSAYWRDAATYLTGGTHAGGVKIPIGAADHARRVLTRLANFATKTTPQKEN